MNIRFNRISIYLLIGLILLVIVILLSGRRLGSHGTVDRFSIDEVEHVLKIRLQDDDQSLDLIRQENGRWLLNNQYPADVVAVNNLLSVLRNAVVKRPVPAIQKEEVTNLLDTHGYKVEVFKQSHWINLPGVIKMIPRKKRIHGFFIASFEGETTSYARLLRSNDPYEIHIPGSDANISRRFVPDVNFWKDPVVISLQPKQIKRVEVHNLSDQARSFVLNVDGNDLVVLQQSDGRVVEQELINMRKMDLFLRSFIGLFYEKLLSDYQVKEYHDYMSDQPFMQIRVYDRSDNQTTLAFYRLDVSHSETLLPIFSAYDPNRFILLVNGETYALAQYLVFNRIMRSLSYFKINHPEEPL